MTKKTATTAKTTAAAKAEAEKVTDRLAEGAREMVKRTTHTAEERAEDLLATSKKYNEQIENVLVRAAHGYANILNNVADAAFVNVNRGIKAAEKLAEAKSLSDAMQIQSEYVREQSTCSMNNARAAVEYVREVVTETSEELRGTATNMMKSDKAA